jgi:hypothetical protein
MVMTTTTKRRRSGRSAGRGRVPLGSLRLRPTCWAAQVLPDASPHTTFRVACYVQWWWWVTSPQAGTGAQAVPLRCGGLCAAARSDALAVSASHAHTHSHSPAHSHPHTQSAWFSDDGVDGASGFAFIHLVVDRSTEALQRLVARCAVASNAIEDLDGEQ